MKTQFEHMQFTALLKKGSGLCDKSFETLRAYLENGWTITNGTAIPQKDHERPHGGVLYILRREIEV